MGKIRLDKLKMIADIDSDCKGCESFINGRCRDINSFCLTCDLRHEMAQSYHIFQDTDDEPHLMFNVIRDRICGCCGGMTEEECRASDCYVLKIKNNLLMGKYSEK